MKLPFFLFLFLLPVAASAHPNEMISSFFDQIAEEVFLSPHQKEISEIRKRVEEKNQEDIARIRTALKFHLQNEKSFSRIKKGETSSKINLISLLEGIPNLGGFLWYSNDQVYFSWGDWSDFYEDGLSVSKIRKEGQISNFSFEKDKFYFFIKNMSGYFPVDFQFLGWETTFFAFGDDGSLRYTNDPLMDHSMRTTEFRKIFESIKRKIPHIETIPINDLTLFLIPGTPRPLYYALFGLRVFLYFWAVYLSYLFLTATFPFLKKKLLKASLPPN